MAGAINFSGFNGFDFNAIIDAIMQSESLPLTNLQTQQKTIQDRDSALVQVGSAIDAFKSDVKDIVASDAFAKVTGTSSDTTVVGVTTGSDAIAGHYDINIDHIAKAQVTTSATGYSDSSAVVADGGSISFTVNGTTTTPIDITSDTTLNQLKNKINDQKSGVIASIVNTGTVSKLVITGRNTGATNGFTVNNTLTSSNTTALAFAAGQNSTTGNTQNALDAALTVNGLNITSASNHVSGAIGGVALNLVKSGTAAVDVTANYDALKTSIKEVADDYNKLRGLKKGSLATDSVMREVLGDIRGSLLYATNNGSTYHYLSEIGLELSQNGDMKFVEAKFNDAIADHLDDLSRFVHQSTKTGVFDSLKSRLDGLDSTAGLIKTTRDSIKSSLDRLTRTIDNQQSRLDQRRLDLEKIYSAADDAMSRLNQAKTSLSSIVG